MKAKKSLGQNFFINKNLGDYIINSLKSTNTDSIVEIGPGMGFFTERLIDIFDNVIVVEKDTKLANSLKLQYPNIRILNKDFLEISFDIFNINTFSFFGSLPYNISKPIIKKIIESDYFKRPSYFIIQKEVADKYIYREPYSLLSLKTAIYADCKKLINISPDSFRPKPNVNSSLICFSPNNRLINNKEKLEDLITKAFKQPRKNIHNNLKNTEYEKGASLFKTYRPAQLDLDSYIDILNHSL